MDLGFEAEDIGQKKGDVVSDGVSQRHQAFLDRCNAGNHLSLRLRTRHRLAARRWLDSIDNHFHWLCNDGDMALFQYTEGHEACQKQEVETLR